MSKEITRLIGIGASAGGLEAIHLLFDKVPTGTEAAYVIIQHLSPDHKSLMPELLSKHTDMKIFTAEDKQALQPNCIYLNQSRKNLHVKGDKLYLLDKGPKQNINLPIDIFFHTLGEEWKEKSIGVILSGTGSDGSRGIKSIKESGGLIIVQSPGSAQFNGMPNATIATGLADFVMDPENIGLAISQYPQKRLETILTNQTEEEIFITILKEVQKLRGIDFTLYKRNTLMRRLEKRIHIHQVDSLKSYLDIFQRELKERELLLQDFLIGVTSFFRDTDSFKLLQNNVFPLLCADRDPTI
ncbi:MAG: chemotaxis protein CheB, partial [Bacteroidota bacterium]